MLGFLYIEHWSGCLSPGQRGQGCFLCGEDHVSNSLYVRNDPEGPRQAENEVNAGKYDGGRA